MRRILSSVVLGLLALAAPALAQSTGLRSLTTGDEGRGWEAVGRLDMGNSAFCTGTLIAPDMVLTAAHCLFDPRSGALVDPGDIEFRAGWRNGRAEAYRGVRRAVAHPEYRYEGRDRMDRVSDDLALLQLDRPIRNLRVTPFETAQTPASGDAVGVVSYAQDRAEAPSFEESCKVMERRAGVLMLTCSVDFGSSGAPVFVVSESGARVASVISAKAMLEGQPVALATDLDTALAPVLDAMAEGAGGVMNSGGTHAFVGTERREIGARFVKP